MFHTLLKHISVSVYIVVVFTLSVFIILSFCAAFICEINNVHIYCRISMYQKPTL